jgi:hypothetical protein
MANRHGTALPGLVAGLRAPAAPDANAFASIEASHAYVARLLQVVDQTADEVGKDLRWTQGRPGRRREALQLVAYKLVQLRFHLAVSRRRLGELRALRLVVDGDEQLAGATDTGKGEAA